MPSPYTFTNMKNKLFGPSPKKENEPPAKFKDMLKDLAESSSLHGIPKIVSTRQIAVKLLWFALFITTCVVLILQVKSLFTTYLANPIQTTVALEFSPIPYPAITFCNMNPIRKSKLGLSTLLTEAVKGKGKKKTDEAEEKDTRKKRAIKYNEQHAHEGSGGSGGYDFYDVDFEDPESQQNVNQYIPSNEQAKEEAQPGVREFEKEHKDDSTQTLADDIPKKLDTAINEYKKWEDSLDVATDILPTAASDIVYDWIKAYTGGETPKSDDYGDYFAEFLEVLERHKREAIESSELPVVPSASVNVDDSGSGSGTGSGSGSGSGSGDYSYYYDYWGGYWGQNSGSGSGSGSGDYYSSYDYSSSYDPYSSGYYSSSYYSGYSDTSSYNPQQYYWEQLYATKDQWDERIDNFQSQIKKEQLMTRVDMGHTVEDMVQGATYAGLVENATRFEPFTTSKYGTCYTMQSPKYIAWRSGPSHGIKLTLNLEIDEYIKNFASGYGIRMVVHEPGTLPLPDEEGLTLSPGSETSVGLKMIRVSRLGKPYGYCSDGSEFYRKYNIRYSSTACMQFCRVEMVMSACDCIPSDAPDIGNFNNTEMDICDPYNKTEKACVVRTDFSFNTGGNTVCHCDSPCTETVYGKTLSGRRWPNDDYLENFLMIDVCKKNVTSMKHACETLENKTFDPLKYRYNFLRVVIYFEDLNFESISQEPLYSLVRFISDIGGAMGLFVGASVLSFVEILQLMLETGLHFKRKYAAKQSDSKVENVNNEALERKASVFQQPDKVVAFANFDEPLRVSPDPHYIDKR